MRYLKENLLVQFSVISFVVMAVIAVVLGIVLSNKIRSDAVDALVNEAVGASRGRLLSVITPADLEVPMTGERYDRFHKFVQQSIVSERTARVKIWAKDGTVIYSNDPKGVGEKYPAKPNLLTALRGENAIEIKIPQDPENERERFLGTLMEVYTPIIFPGSSEPQGSFEVYQYYAPIADRINRLRGWLFGAIAVGFVILYGGLISTVWGGWRTIVWQRSRLEFFNAELEEQVQERTAELEASNDRIRLILETAQEAFIAIDANGLILDWNKEAEAIFGWSHEEILGQTLAETIIPPQYREAHRRGLQHFLATGEGPVLNRRLELAGLHRDGNEFPLELTITAVRERDSHIFNAFLHDITERKKMTQQLTERTTQLQVVNRELEAFTYAASHDLRAPLQSIDGFSQLLVEDYAEKLDTQGKDYLQHVRTASKRMGQLINDLLSLSRVTHSEMWRERVDLSTLARETVAELQRVEPERQVEFIIAEGMAAEGDGGLLRVALDNLLGNAWKFTSKHPRARIEFGVTHNDGMQAYFVRDDGVGFDMAHADKLFGAFQRLHSPSEFAGSGIGLATVQRIIHRHNGRIWAEGAVEQGATFYFTLN